VAEIQAIFDTMTRWARSPFPYYLYYHTKEDKKYFEVYSKLEKKVTEQIKKMSTTESKSYNLLNVLINEFSSYKELLPQLMEFVIAGYGTTTVALTNCFYMLAKHPHYQGIIKNEFSSTSSYDEMWTRIQTRNFINETLRRYPVSGFWWHQNHVPVTLGGKLIPKDTTFLFYTSPYVLQAFADGDKFIPERWNSQLTPEQSFWGAISFGGFRRLCVGQNLALTELISLISATCSDFQIKLAQGQQDVDLSDCDASFIMETRQDIYVTLTPNITVH